MMLRDLYNRIRRIRRVNEPLYASGSSIHYLTYRQSLTYHSPNRKFNSLSLHQPPPLLNKMEPSTANSELAEVRPATQDGISIGLGVFAKTDLVKGKEILVLDDPPIALLEEKQLKTICSACFDTSEGGSIDIRKTWLVKACVRCKVVYYCDKV